MVNSPRMQVILSCYPILGQFHSFCFSYGFPLIAPQFFTNIKTSHQSSLNAFAENQFNVTQMTEFMTFFFFQKGTCKTTVGRVETAGYPQYLWKPFASKLSTLYQTTNLTGRKIKAFLDKKLNMVSLFTLHS